MDNSTIESNLVYLTNIFIYIYITKIGIQFIFIQTAKEFNVWTCDHKINLLLLLSIGMPIARLRGTTNLLNITPEGNILR